MFPTPQLQSDSSISLLHKFNKTLAFATIIIIITTIFWSLSIMGSISHDVYINGEFSAPMSAQHDYSHQHDRADPEQAMSVYAKSVVITYINRSPSTNFHRTMHQHTKEQFELAQKSARRRSGPSSPIETTSTSLRKGSTSTGSVSSIDSWHGMSRLHDQ
jgi:hypothetical protein